MIVSKESKINFTHIPITAIPGIFVIRSSEPVSTFRGRSIKQVTKV